jgi:hypothetical protein
VLEACRIVEVTGSKDRDEEINPFTPSEVVLILEALRTRTYALTCSPFE